MSTDRVTRWIAATVAILVAAALVVFRHRLSADFWPLDNSRVGPNIVASIVTWAVLLIVSALLWPPTRRRIHQFLDRKLERVHGLLARHDEHNEWVARHVAALHRQITGTDPDPHPHFEIGTNPTPDQETTTDDA